MTMHPNHEDARKKRFTKAGSFFRYTQLSAAAPRISPIRRLRDLLAV
jgi:hypothetical protein